MGFDPIEEVIAAYGRGEIVVITDDENRENEGDLIAAASHADAGVVNFMVTHGRGLFCVPLAPEIAARLGLAQPDGNHDPRCTCFTEPRPAFRPSTGRKPSPGSWTRRPRLTTSTRRAMCFR